MSSETVRLDSWLWAARFFKTRPLAVSAIKNGRVLVNGARAKPARPVAPGDLLSIRKEEDYSIEVIIHECMSKRVSAKIAQTWYEETAESISAREAWQAKRQIARDMVRFPDSRPDKRERRQLRAIRHQDKY